MPSRSSILVLVHQRFFAAFCLVLGLLLNPRCVSGQTPVNGQTYTNGLAIVDSPQINSSFRGSMPYAVEVSGNGKLSSQSYASNSDEPTRFDMLEIYLTSDTKKFNMTVSGNSTLLDQEPGSTVKHGQWNVPPCVPGGSYNLTLYEGSHVDGNPYFSITSIPVQVEGSGDSQSGNCAGRNDFQAGVQISSPPTPNPVQVPGSSSTSSSRNPNPNPNPTVITIVISGSGPLPFDFPTVTVTDILPPVTRTVVLESLITLTTVMPGPTDSVTVTITTTGQTTTTVVSQGDGNGTFLPIGAASRSMLLSSIFPVLASLVMGVYLVLS